MKRLFPLLFCLFFAASLRAGIPTPDYAMTFRIDKDARNWAPQSSTGDKHGFMMEFVLPGDSVKNWKEMVAQQIVITKVPLRKYVDTWKVLMLKADAQIDIKEEPVADGSILATYTAPEGDEISIRRFISRKDGIYMLAYFVRPKLKRDETFKLWKDIILTANLIPNPQK